MGCASGAVIDWSTFFDALVSRCFCLFETETCMLVITTSFAITDITAMSSGAQGKTITKMNGCPVSLKQMNLQRNIERTGHDRYKKSMSLIPSRARNVRRKIVPLSLSEFPYLVPPLMLKRIQYSAMIANFTTPDKLLFTKQNLE